MGTITRTFANKLTTSGTIDATTGIDGVIPSSNITNASVTNITTLPSSLGDTIESTATDPAYTTDGTVWYNTTTATLKAWLPTGAWISGGNLNTARGLIGGAGTQTAGLGIAGYLGAGSYTAATEKYNGIAWTNNPTGVNTPRGFIGACGTQTAALAVGGYGPTESSAVESWNGSIWTSTTSLPAARYGALTVGTQTAALAINGQTPLPAGLTTSWNGTSWTALPGITNNARGYLMGFGTQTAAIAAAGRISPGASTNFSESWNGSAWTNTSNVNTARFTPGGLGAGTQASGLIFGGSQNPGLTGATESWNGTSWTSNPTGLSTARTNLAGYGSQSSALAVGGQTPSVTGATEEWNFGVYSYTAAAWASGGNLNTARYFNAGMGVGTQTASLVFGGFTTAGLQSAAESYNGSAWTNITSLPTTRAAITGFGTQSAALGAGGTPAPGTTSVLSWNGTSWSAGTSMGSTRYGALSAGTQTAGLVFGSIYQNETATESWNGSSWTTSGNLNTNGGGAGSAGIQTAALIFGGGGPPMLNRTESYNGTSWTTVPGTLNTSRGAHIGGAGLQTSALAFGADTNTFTSTTATEQFNGTAWSNVNPMSTSRSRLAGNGSQTAALASGGFNNTTQTTATEEWTGETETAVAKSITTS